MVGKLGDKYKDFCWCKKNGVYGTLTSEWARDTFDLYNIIDDFKIGYSLTQSLKEECECHGFYMRSGHAFSCKAGFYNDGNCSSTCKACPVGKWSEEGASSCEFCPGGTFRTGGTSCKNCPIGYSSSQGDSACSICTDGKYTDGEGSATCKTCPTGFYEDEVEDGKACSKCEAGKSSSDGITCTLCAAGKFHSDGASHPVCVSCPTGWYTDEIQSADGKSCTECLGYYKDADGSEKSYIGDTTKDYTGYEDGTVCQLCKNGRNGAHVPKDLVIVGPPDTAAKQRVQICLTCPKGYYQDEDSKRSCKACPGGYYQDKVAGFAYPHLPTTYCTACAPGYYSASNTEPCKVCNKGQYEETSGSYSCKYCANYADWQTQDKRRPRYSWQYADLSSGVYPSSEAVACNLYTPCDGNNWISGLDYCGQEFMFWTTGVVGGVYSASYRRCCYFDSSSSCEDFAKELNDPYSSSWTSYDIGNGQTYCEPPTTI